MKNLNLLKELDSIESMKIYSSEEKSKMKEIKKNRRIKKIDDLKNLNQNDLKFLNLFSNNRFDKSEPA